MGNSRPTFMQIFFSVLAAMFGVQSQANREFDFTHGHIRDYALVGIILTIGFVIIVIGVVKSVLYLSGV